MTVTLKYAGTEETIDATPDMLNMLSITFDEACEYNRTNHRFGLAEQARAYAHQIYEALNESGYYSNFVAKID